MSQVLDDKQPRKDKAKPKYEPIDFYQKNTYVDCKDSVNAWCVARILERCDDDFTLKINFDGWSHKWDEWVRFSSTRLAPFRKYSVGYTGQTKFAIRDWKFSLAELKLRTERLKEIIDSNFTVLKSSFQITQCLRGSEFIYVDCLIEHEYLNPKEELPYVFKHFDVCFELYLTFLKMIPEYLPDYFEGISNLDSFLTNERIALILSFHEVSEIVNCIFGFSDRLWQQFRTYDTEFYGAMIVTPEEHAGKDINTTWTADETEEESDNYVSRKSKKHSKLICKLVNKFGSMGGIDAWMKTFTYCRQDEENTQNPNHVHLLPFRMMEVLLKTLSNIYEYLNKDIAENMIVTIKDIILKRLEFIPDRELKELDRDDITKFISKVQSLLVQYYSRDEVISLTETAELDLDLKFLTCSFFEKRLKGIIRIKELAEKIDLYEQDPKIASQSSSPKLLKHLDSKTFIAWIFKNRIFELILGDSIHTEIIKRTHEILKFIGKYETIPNSLLELLWNACEGKHEATVMGLYDTIVEICGHLQPEGVSFLKQKIEAIPDDQQNEMTLNLIKGFAENTLPRLTEAELDQGNNVDESRFNCVVTLWHLMLDESKVNIGMSEAALKNMVSILREPVCVSLRKVYLFRCFEQVSKKDSVSQCINLIHSILNGQYYTRGYDTRNSLGAILEQLDEKFGLMELMVSEFEHFYTQVGELVRKNHNGDIPEELKDRSLIGKYSYSVNYHNRLIFLSYLANNQAYELVLTVDQIERLWNLVALNPIWESDREYFLQWLSFRYEGQTYIRPVCVVNKNLMGEFFGKILSNQRKLDFANLSPKGFEMFVSHFKALNEQKANFRVDRTLKFLIDDLDYEGKDTLWSIFLHCRNEKTTKNVINLLVECHLQLGAGLEKKRKQLWEDFTYKCVNLLKDGHDKQDDKLITKAVIVLMHFFDKFEGKNRLELGKDDNSRNSYNMRITAILKPEQNMKSVLVNSQQTIGYLKGLIADRFGFLIDEIEISVRGNTIENDEDSNPLLNYPVTEPFILQRAQLTRTQDGGYHPKQLISENVECIDLLFQLLSEDLQAVNTIWDLLVRLPVSEKTKQSIYEMSNSWESLLGGQSMQQYKLLYCLKIIEDFLFDQSIEKPKSVYKALDSIPTQFKDPTWAQRFCESGGLRTLLDVLSKPEIVDIKSIISLKCLTLLLKIVCAFFLKYNFDNIYGDDARKKEGEVTQRVIEIIHNTSEYSISREHKDPKPDPSTQPFVKTFSKAGDEILRVPEDLFFESKVIYYAQSLFLSLVQHNTTLLTHIYEYPSLQRMLSIGLIETDNNHLKEKLSQGLLNLMTQFPKADAPLLPHHIFVPVLLQDTLQKALENEDRSEVFFRMLTSLINHINIGEVSLDADDLLSQLVDFLRLRKPMEKNQRDFDIVLHGVLLVLKGLFARYPDKAQKYGQEEELVIELLQNCLFEIPRRVDRKQVPGPKCKNIHTRSAAYKLLIELSRDSDFNLQEIIEYIKPIHQYGKWRTKRFLDWNIVQKDNEKSSTGYVGLKNLGCICYMNSTIQQIYMIPSFRNAILEVEDKQLAVTPKEDNILYQLKCIFGALNESEKQYFNPKNFCQSFKDWDGNPTNVYEQMDADEFFLMFMDRLENLIKGTKQENFIKQHFGGVLSNELICKGCPHYSEREEPFLAVSLQVKNKKNIYQSLAAFVEGEMLEGDNAYHCAQCDKKVNTLKRVCLKKLPNHLILVLKRFEFDFDTMAKVKVNDYCEFPTKLDLEPYTQQGLRKAEKAKQAENKEGEQENDAEVQDEYPKSYFEYKLTGVVIHVGFADSGHYISLAQDREATENPNEQQWYEFNDTEVRFFDPKDIPAEAYGGEEKWRYTANQNMTSYREKIKNAYLLFYERITHFDDPQQNTQPDPNAVQKKEEEFKEDQEERLSFSTAATDRPPSHLKMIRSDRAPGIFRRLEIEPKISDDSKKHYPQDFLHGLLDKNQIFLIHKHVFSKEYFDFIQELVMQRQYVPRLQYTPNEALSPADNAKEYYDLEMIKFGTLFLLTAVLRDRMRTNIIKFLPFIKERLSQNIAASVWLLEVFSSKKIQLEFFLDCPIADMRRFAIGVVVTAFRTVYNHKLKEGGELFVTGKGFRMDKTLSSVLTNFVNCSINLIFESKAAGRYYTEFFKLFYEIAACGHHAVGYLIARKVIGRFMDFFYEEVSPLNAFFRDMSDVPYWEPENADIGEPQEEKTKVRTAWEEYMFKKKDNKTIESFSVKSYLWKTLCYLLLHCKMTSASQRCEWQIGDYDYQVLQKEKTLLTPDTKFVIKVIDDADTKISYRSVAKFYSYLCYEDEDFTATFMEAIKSCLNVCDTTCLRPSLRCFTTLLTVQDSLTEFRVKELCEFFTNLMNNSSLYYLEVDAYSAFLLKITSKLDSVKEWVLSHKDTWSWVITWLTKHPVPPIGMTQDHIKLQKRRNAAGAPILHNRIHEYKGIASIKLRKFKKMLQDEIEDPKNKWDSDEDLSEHKFVAGEKVDFDPQKTGRWCTAEVEHVLEEMIKVTYYVNEKDQDFQWVSKDIPNIALPNTMTAVQAQIEAESQKFLEVQNNAEQNVHDQDTDHEEGYQKITDGGPENSDHSDTLTPN